ncbi:hypothetical protein L6164_012084 [Bauhinia variegata]|uniref:Uncharacterized protein n=1 Tax=Bauhinia variegata TaxID=167791 RepID=A0ACB9P8Q7_BAUVA|nr:hypothetical protein L6164_012084 [Bauhinia variegata]
MMEEVVVVIVGGGPAGLATAACLNRLFIPNIVLERDDCHAPLWRKRTYDRLNLHLGKEFCALPHMPFPDGTPTFVPRVCFMQSASLENDGRWRILVKDTTCDGSEVYVATFLVVATGENGEGFIPKIIGLDNFQGEYMHSNRYLNGREWYGKNVLVVGCGNSGMEIAYDLSNWGANTSIVIRNEVHVVTREMVLVAMHLLKFLQVELVDELVVFLSRMKYGNLSKYGLSRPKEGPFSLKVKTGRSPTIDVGCIDKIKKGEIKVFPAVYSIKEDKMIQFEDGREECFDVIIFATGYKSNVLNWLKDYKHMFNEDGMPKKSNPNHWKGENGIYCAGFSSQGLMGISYDAKHISDDISLALSSKEIPSTFAPLNLVDD